MPKGERGFVYCVDDPGLEDLCEPCLEELAERLAERLGLGVEMVFDEAGSERIDLYDPEDEEAVYGYRVRRRAH
ncbi:hypothetical protein Ocepr_2290 (plasmid) [Oceanithermus profundus DSM 14977]|uniref:Uncharacterized protein n=1 Tax=Oceanithermus profundus (strain DSM 14977 / NBRC 100410 / VKM B-2274 / 506) TaxID=670487 RepID=E4UAV3_OCEP5|nr:hypothetical protein [Oceanithermus profundus]ADR37738.1 hypothetical protein Ocepr_2290 [Oceanithermus profundus DSM 14977]